MVAERRRRHSKTCAAVLETSGWSPFARTKPRGLSIDKSLMSFANKIPILTIFNSCIYFRSDLLISLQLFKLHINVTLNYSKGYTVIWSLSNSAWHCYYFNCIKLNINSTTKRRNYSIITPITSSFTHLLSFIIN